MQKKIHKVGFILLFVLMVANVICAVKGLAGVDIQAESIGWTRINSMFAAIFAYFAWQKK